MPTMERWHCVLTDTEKGNSPSLHLFDWKPYQKGSGDPYLSLRKVDPNPHSFNVVRMEWHENLADIHNTTTYWNFN